MTELTINLLSKCWTIHNRDELTVSGRVGNILHVSIYPPSITVRGPWDDMRIPLDKITIVRDGSQIPPQQPTRDGDTDD